jgi:hypothetical protein
MKQLLVLGSTILAAGKFSISDTAVSAGDAIFPLAAIPGSQVVEAETPDDFTPSTYEWHGALVAKAPPPIPREQLKAKRETAVEALTVTVGGKVFDGDETSQDRMTRALKAADLSGQATCTWVLHDNSAVTVTRQELEQALVLSIQAQAAIWVIHP